jgi:ferredoxin
MCILCAMPKVTFITPDGQTKVVEGEDEKTILQVSLDNGIPMEHACGGNGFCTTCICKIKDGQKMIDDGSVNPVNDKEENMGVEGPDLRLGCQAKVQGDLEVKVGEE